MIFGAGLAIDLPPFLGFSKDMRIVLSMFLLKIFARIPACALHAVLEVYAALAGYLNCI